MVLASIGCLSGPVHARRGTGESSAIPLEVLSYDDAERAGAVGTGCTWRGADRKRRMSMADDRAAVRWNGVVVALKPALDAKAIFLTYDRWTFGKSRIVVRDTGKVVRKGYEFSETIAALELTEGGKTSSYPGRLNCGS